MCETSEGGCGNTEGYTSEEELGDIDDDEDFIRHLSEEFGLPGTGDYSSYTYASISLNNSSSTSAPLMKPYTATSFSDVMPQESTPDDPDDGPPASPQPGPSQQPANIMLVHFTKIQTTLKNRNTV